jgi:hypothetical protein
MDKKIVIAIMTVVALIAVSAAALVIMTKDNTDMSYNTDGIRVTIYGNANGDDVIDEKDKRIIEKIVSDDIKDWKTKYIYADADQDGKITDADAKVVQNYIDRKTTTLYYKDFFGTIAHIPYPIGNSVGIDHPYPAFIMAAAGVYDKLTAVDDASPMYYDDSVLPGLSKMKIIGSSTKITLEQVKAANIDAFIIYSNWPGHCYLYEEAAKSGLADKVAFISVDIQQLDGASGTLMIGALFNTNDSVKISQEYAGKVDAIKTKLESSNIAKETVIFDYIAQWGSDYYQYIAGGAANPVSKLAVKFTKEYENAGNIMVDEETLVAASKNVPIIIQFQKPAGVERADMDKYLKERIQDMLTKTDAYSMKKIYAIDSDIINGVAGAYFGAYLTAAMFYDTIDYNDAIKELEDFLKNYIPAKIDSSLGYAYTNKDLF